MKRRSVTTGTATEPEKGQPLKAALTPSAPSVTQTRRYIVILSGRAYQQARIDALLLETIDVLARLLGSHDQPGSDSA